MNTLFELRDFIQNEMKDGEEVQIDNFTFIHKIDDTYAEVYRKVESLNFVFKDKKTTVIDAKTHDILNHPVVYSGCYDMELGLLNETSRSETYIETIRALWGYDPNYGKINSTRC